MEQETYEKIIELLVGKLNYTEWCLKNAEERNAELRKENETLRSEK